MTVGPRTPAGERASGEAGRPVSPRILAIMGSGETAPTMARVHRQLFDRFGAEPVPAAILDTPYGFQENADQLSERTVEFFRTSVGRPISIASYRSRDVDRLTSATAIARLREARYIMAGPGSPSYALRQWIAGPIPEVIESKLAEGGIVTVASAAAVTIGLVSIPVYEIYKVGEELRWLEGLDLLGATTGLRAAVVPHFDNAEGGNHDTRFCYMGERRLRLLERQMPDDAFILGVDGHTALIFDLDARTAAVAGAGSVTVRVDGRGTLFPSGSEIPIETLAQVAKDLGSDRPVDIGWEPGPERGGASDPGTARPASAAGSSGDVATDFEAAFIDAVDGGDVPAAVGVLLDLDAAIAARLRAGEDSPDLDAASATLQSLIARLGELAQRGARDPREMVDPFVSALIDLRTQARARQDWETADLVRSRLVGAGIEVHDEAGASSWDLPSVQPSVSAGR